MSKWLRRSALPMLLAAMAITGSIVGAATSSAAIPGAATPAASASAPSSGRDPVVIAVGDISCGEDSTSAMCRQMATSDLALAANPDAVLVLGDNQYECGELADYQAFFDPSWGRLKGKIHPAIGNHEYQVSKSAGSHCIGVPKGAPGYWTYFGAAANPLDPGCRVSCQGYYSWDLGAWHFIVLNDECNQIGVGGCGPDAPEIQWLKDDLARHANRCVLAYWHQPRFSSGHHGSFEQYQPFWQALYDAGAEIVLNGHDHDYERFAPQDPTGAVDADHGLREFVVGTGGRNHTALSEETGRLPNSEVFDNTTFGVLKLTLHPSGYDWEFVPVVEEGQEPFTDAGSGSCHDAPVPRATPAPSPSATPNAATPAGVTAGATAAAGPMATPAAAGSVLFQDGFESGDLSAWTSANGLQVEATDVASGSRAVRATSTGAPTFARKKLASPQPELYYRVKFKLLQPVIGATSLIKFRTVDNSSILTVSISGNEKLSYHNDVTDESATSATKIAPGVWHDLLVHVRVADPSGETEVWLDGLRLADVSGEEPLGATLIGRIQLGENSPGGVYDIVFDDVVVSTSPAD